MKPDYKKQGKKNRSAGRRFEIKVRHDLESQGWIVSKWQNNVELEYDLEVLFKKVTKGRLIKVKNKFRGPGIPMMLGSGFPDFIAFPKIWEKRDLYLGETLASVGSKVYQTIIGIEVKSNGILSKEEKEKCSWLLRNGIFSKILIAKKGEKRGTIKYVEFKS